MKSCKDFLVRLSWRYDWDQNAEKLKTSIAEEDFEFSFAPEKQKTVMKKLDTLHPPPPNYL